MPNDQKKLRICLVKLSSLGDVIQAGVVLQFIRQKIPNANITWVVDSIFADVFKNNIYVDEIIALPLRAAKKNYSLFPKIFKTLLSYKNKFDVIIDLQGLIKSAFVTRMLGKNSFGFAKNCVREKLAAFLYKHEINIPYHHLAQNRYVELVCKALNISITEREIVNKKTFLFCSEEDNEYSRKYFISDKKNIIFVIGSTWQSRKYPPEHFAELGNRFKENILIPYANDQEYKDAKLIVRHCRYAKVLPKMKLSQLVACISQADLLIGGDTGPSYIGFANNIPTILIHGPTPARVSSSELLVIIKSASKIDPYHLNKNDFSIKAISPQIIFDAGKDLLKTLASYPLLHKL